MATSVKEIAPEGSGDGQIEKSEETQNDMPAAMLSEGTVSTAPFDPRFPNTNQTRYCYQSYLDFHRCQKVKGQGYAPCNYFKKMYEALCPNAWVEKWDDQIDGGSFSGHI
nr:cytochrome c oxidase subunit 6B-like isoform X3 [Onthophagus taurus]